MSKQIFMHVAARPSAKWRKLVLAPSAKAKENTHPFGRAFSLALANGRTSQLENVRDQWKI